jgi:hypothetical protein
LALVTTCSVAAAAPGARLAARPVPAALLVPARPVPVLPVVALVVPARLLPALLVPVLALPPPRPVVGRPPLLVRSAIDGPLRRW